MHYLFQSWFIAYMSEALNLPLQKIIAELSGLSDRTLRNYNKKPKSDFLKIYTKIMKGFYRMGVFREKDVENHIHTLDTGEFRGFHIESLYRQIQLEEPELIKFIYCSVSFFDSWSRLGDQRNIPEYIFLDDKENECLEWMKSQYPYSQFDLNLLFEIYNGKRPASDDTQINVEIGFAMLVAVNMDFFTASNIPFKEDDLVGLVCDAISGKNLTSLWFQRIRDEHFQGSKEEFYKEYAKNSTQEKDGEIVCMDEADAKRTYIRMCNSGKADWIQIFRISNTLCKNEIQLAIALHLRFVLLRCIGFYAEKVNELGVKTTKETYSIWTQKWADNFTQHHP